MTSAARSCWVVIPIKAADESKRRLAGVLGQQERMALVDAMLAHVVAAASQAPSVERVCLLGPSRHGLPEDLPLLDDPKKGLNPAVQSALAGLTQNGPDRAVFIAADLPAVSPLDIELLANLPAGTLGIAPDRHGTGTNALSLPLPDSADFRFAYGPGSFARHDEEAMRLGLRVETLLSRGLEKDIDVPADLPDAEAIWDDD